MKHKLPLAGRMALYDYRKKREAEYKAKAFEALGGKRAACGAVETLRVRFVNSDHPLSAYYRTNPATLYRRICLEDDVRQAVHLLCRSCRLSDYPESTLGERDEQGSDC